MELDFTKAVATVQRLLDNSFTDETIESALKNAELLATAVSSANEAGLTAKRYKFAR